MISLFFERVQIRLKWSGQRSSVFRQVSVNQAQSPGANEPQPFGKQLGFHSPRLDGQAQAQDGWIAAEMDVKELKTQIQFGDPPRKIRQILLIRVPEILTNI